MKLLTKRIYDAYNAEIDGFRVLVDRLWPRGVNKENAHLNLWAKNITPSTELREWFHANRDLYPEFENRYLSELKSNPNFEGFLNDIRDHDVVTLLTAVKNIEESHVPILVKYISKMLG